MATNDFSRLADNLKNKGYRVSVFAAAADAVAYLDREIDGATVGFGGSMTLHQLNLFPALQRHNTVYWHDEKPEGMSVMETRRLPRRRLCQLRQRHCRNGRNRQHRRNRQPRRRNFLRSGKGVSDRRAK